jgi:hypothetical protein
VQTIFEEARKLGAIVVFDNAQVLFDHSELSSKASQLIQYHAKAYPRPVIVLATVGGGTSSSASLGSLDIRASHLQFSNDVQFQLPNRVLRDQLWRRSLPALVPLSPNVDFNELSQLQLSAKLIRTICFNACCKAALLPLKERIVSMKMLLDERDDILQKERYRSHATNMFI